MGILFHVYVVVCGSQFGPSFCVCVGGGGGGGGGEPGHEASTSSCLAYPGLHVSVLLLLFSLVLQAALPRAEVRAVLLQLVDQPAWEEWSERAYMYNVSPKGRYQGASPPPPFLV